MDALVRRRLTIARSQLDAVYQQSAEPFTRFEVGQSSRKIRTSMPGKRALGRRFEVVLQTVPRNIRGRRSPRDTLAVKSWRTEAEAETMRSSPIIAKGQVTNLWIFIAAGMCLSDEEICGEGSGLAGNEVLYRMLLKSNQDGINIELCSPSSNLRLCEWAVAHWFRYASQGRIISEQRCGRLITGTAISAGYLSLPTTSYEGWRGSTMTVPETFYRAAAQTIGGVSFRR
jgi:hypothetical protein